MSIQEVFDRAKEKDNHYFCRGLCNHCYMKEECKDDYSQSLKTEHR